MGYAVQKIPMPIFFFLASFFYPTNPESRVPSSNKRIGQRTLLGLPDKGLSPKTLTNNTTNIQKNPFTGIIFGVNLFAIFIHRKDEHIGPHVPCAGIVLGIFESILLQREHKIRQRYS